MSNADHSTEMPRSWLGEVAMRTLGATGARLGLVWIVIVAFCAVFAPYVANSFPIVARTVDGRLISPMYQHLSGVDVLLPVLAMAAVVMSLFRVRFGRQMGVLLWMGVLLVPFLWWKPVADYVAFTVGNWGAVDPQGRAIVASHGWSALWSTLLGVGLLVDVALIVWLGWRGLRTPSVAARRAYGMAAVVIAAVAAMLVMYPLDPTANPVYSTYREQQADGRIAWAVYTIVPFSPSDRLTDQPVEVANPAPWAPSWAYHAGVEWKGQRVATPRVFEHVMGTEVSGADIFSNMIHACRIAMSIGFISTGIAVVIAVLVGGLMGYFVGWVDLLGMRIVEIFAAIPTIYLLLTFVAFFPRNLYIMMVIIGLTAWVGKAYFVRAEFLKLRNQDFVQAAVAAGLPLRSVLFKHILPNALAPLLVSASFSVASAILAESSLSFLGLGLVDEPSWGRLLDQARSAGGGFYWWLGLFPGLAIFLTVLAYNLIGEAVRDALDVRK